MTALHESYTYKRNLIDLSQAKIDFLFEKTLNFSYIHFEINSSLISENVKKLKLVTYTYVFFHNAYVEIDILISAAMLE